MLLNLIQEQIKQGLEPVIASIGEKGIKKKPLETEAIKRGYKIVKFRMFPGPNLPGMWKVLRYAQEHGFDILHSHGYKGNVTFGLMPKKLRKLPLFSTLHGYTSVSGISKNRIYEWLDLISLKHVNAVILVNRGMLSNPRLRKLKGEKIHIVNNGIPIPDDGSPSHLPTFPPSAFSKGDPDIVNFCTKGFTIGSIGRFSTEKGFKYLIEALSLLVKNGIDARLVIIGEGYKRSALEELTARLGLEDRILFPGYKDDAKYYISFFDVYVIPSLTEGLPITLLEAMQAKTPVVATKVGGIPHVLKNNKSGLLVKPRSPDAIAQAVMALHNDKKLADELTSKAYHRVITDFSSKTMALGYLNIYKKT